MKSKVLPTTLILAFGMGGVVLLPIGDYDTDFSPVASAWAGPNCDADGDGLEKVHKKCAGDDIDDSDPCVPNENSLACDSGGSGGGGGDLGSAISMDCILAGEWSDLSFESIKGDGLANDLIDGTRYSDAVDKVDCSVDGPSTPWPIRLGMGVKGRPENSVRKVDVILGDFVMPTIFNTDPDVDQGRLGDRDDLLTDYASLFDPAPADGNGPDFDFLDPIRINVRPYRERLGHSADGIHLMPWSADPYGMGMRFSIPGTERFNFSVAREHYPGNESFTGIGCETGFEQEILDYAPGGGMKDVSVYLWVDDDGDGYPDGYTVSTGAITPAYDEVNEVYLPGPPAVDGDTKYAAVCSSVGPDTCGNPRAPSYCNFLGYVPVQFTMHARVK